MLRNITAATATVLLAASLTGCSLFDGSESPATTPASTPTETSTPSQSPPSLNPDLAASENLPYFDQVNAEVIAANPDALGGDFTSALVAAGFDPAAMEVTADRTSVDLEADSVQFSVLFQGECIVGQYGPKSGGYHSAVRPALGTGTCLVGLSQPIAQ